MSAASRSQKPQSQQSQQSEQSQQSQQSQRVEPTEPTQPAGPVEQSGSGRPAGVGEGGPAAEARAERRAASGTGGLTEHLTENGTEHRTESRVERRAAASLDAAASAAASVGSAATSLPRMLKPRLRGWLHAGMFPAVLFGGIFLTALADSTRGRIACAVYAVTACLLFGVSALYHRGDWSPRANAVLRRLDHANIFLIIAGTYTPLTILLVPGGSQEFLLYGIWAAAALGIAFRVFWVGAPRWLYTPCYVAMGWAAVFYLPDFLRTGGIAVLVCVLLGGVLYSAGGLVYGIKRPNPSPRWFGFHEVFHSFTLAAFVAHYVGISLVAYQHA